MTAYTTVRRPVFALLLLLLFAVACTQPPDVADVVDVDLPDDYPLDAAPETRGPDLARWVVDFDEALLLSAERSRPVLALYREPAGITDQPLMAEAVEDLFVPLVLPAGNGGCRVFDAAGLDLIPPEETVETPGQLAALMVRALETDGGEAPGWLRLVAEELGDAERRMMTLTMYCYWEGEAKLGNLDGVLATRSGYMGEDEVVEVVYDADRLGFDELVGKAKELDCDDRFYVHTAADYDRARELVGRKAAPAPERAEAIEFTEVKYALRRTPMGRLPLTPLQGTKMNADIRFETDPRRWLSPRQLAMLDDVKQLLAENPNALDDFLPPDQPRQLADYQARLLEKLGIGGIGDR